MSNTNTAKRILTPKRTAVVTGEAGCWTFWRASKHLLVRPMRDEAYR